MIRKLTSDDFELAKNLVPEVRLAEFKETYLTGLSMWMALGYFKDDILTGIVGVYYPRQYPEWQLIEQYCDDSNELTDMMDQVCSAFESYKIYRFSWILRDYDIDNLKNFIPVRYTNFLDYKTDPWSRPTFSGHFGSLFMNDYLPVSSETYCSVLQGEFRK